MRNRLIYGYRPFGIYMEAAKTKTPQQVQSQETKTRILFSAAKLFSKRGFYGTSISDLAAETRLTKGAIYHHFANKDALFFEVLKLVQKIWRAGVIANVMKTQNAVDRLTTMLENHFQLINKQPFICLVVSELYVENEGVNQGFTEAIHKIYAEMRNFILQIIQQGQTRGEIRKDIDADLLALNIMYIIKGFGSSSLCIENTVATDLRSIKPLLQIMSPG